jgi:hypothetical protein
MPCTDAVAEPLNSSAPQTAIMKSVHGHQHNCNHECSPFCTCNCCSTACFVAYKQVMPLKLPGTQFTSVNKIALLNEKVVSNFYGNIWQPPKV